MKYLTDLAREAKGLDLNKFTARYPRAALLLPNQGSRDVREGKIDTPSQESEGAETAVSMAAPLMPTAIKTPSPEDDDGTVVFFLTKTDRNPFSTMITIGRAKNNDIVLEIPTVSKLHAYVVARGGTNLIFDQGSRNGVTVDGRRLGASEGVALKDGAVIQLAPGLHLRYYSPTALFGILALRSQLGR
jgi:pSer/pThr/pTyr-binding forkhead associated (FHA) protein